MYDKYIERIEQLNEQGQHMALQMLDDLLSNKKNRKDIESPRQRFIRETDQVLALIINPTAEQRARKCCRI